MPDVVIQELGLDIGQFEQNAQRVDTIWDHLDTRSVRMGKESPFKKQTDDLIKFNNQLKSGGVLFQKIEAGPKGLKAEINRLSAEYVKLITSQDRATRSGDWKKTEQDIQRVRNRLAELQTAYDQTADKADKASKAGSKAGKGGGGSGLVDMVLGAGSSLLGAFGIGLGAKEIIEGIVSVRAEYQRLENQLTVTLGSKSAAAAAQQLIIDFANKTPHEIAGVTSAFTRLVDIGIVPTEKQLFQLSDIALSKNKSISDYVEAIADAQHGEFERLKEFSIDASKSGDKVVFTFKGIRTEVDNTSTAINDYLLSLGSVNGVAGQTEVAGKSLEGRWSTLKDTFAGVANTIGTLLQPAMENLLDLAQKGADKFKGFWDAVALVYQKKGLLEALSLFVAPFGAQERIDDALNQKKEDDYRSGDARDEADALDQAREAAEARNKKGDADRKAAADKVTADKAAKKAAEKQKQINLDILRETQKQVTERKKLQEELVKLEADYDKQRLESLDKNSTEYIQLKRKLDLAEIDQQRKKVIELGQMATGTPFYNTKTKRVEVKKNEKYALPAQTEAQFTNQRAVIEGRSAEAEYDAEQLKKVKDFRDAEAKYEKDQAKKREDIQRKSAETELQLRAELIDAEADLIRKAGESEADYEKRKNAALLKIRLDYYQKLLELAEKDPSQKAQILGLKETIAGLQKEIKENTTKANTGPQDLWDLLGITFDTNAEKNDQFKQLANQAVNTVLSSAQSILEQQLQTDQARIDSYDRLIAAKQNEIQAETTLAAAGLANNLTLKKQEEAQLQSERKKAVEAQRRDQTIQISLNALLQESEMALAVAKIFSANASIPLIGYITAGVQIAAMIALFASTISQISNLPKYHDGDEVSLETAKRRTTAGARRSDEIDARLQIGEGVIRKQSYQPNKRLFKNINAYNRSVRSSDLADLLDGTGIELPDSVRLGDMTMINQVNESRGIGPDRELHRRVDGVSNRLDELIDETRRGRRAKTEYLPDGRIRVTNENGDVKVYRPS